MIHTNPLKTEGINYEKISKSDMTYSKVEGFQKLVSMPFKRVPMLWGRQITNIFSILSSVRKVNLRLERVKPAVSAGFGCSIGVWR
jgi:hypothetical protein